MHHQQHSLDVIPDHQIRDYWALRTSFTHHGPQFIPPKHLHPVEAVIWNELWQHRGLTLPLSILSCFEARRDQVRVPLFLPQTHTDVSSGLK